MRILPDLNFRESYKKHYEENYAKIQTGIKNISENMAAVKAEKSAVRAEKKISYKSLLAGIAVLILFAAFLAIIRVTLSVKFSPKQEEIKAIQTEITELQTKIYKYEAIDYDMLTAEAAETANIIADLQNQYLYQSFDKDFKVNADKYLGSYNYNWLRSYGDKTRELTEPAWKSYLHKGSEISNIVTAVFILYDNGCPVGIISADLSFDDFGNYFSLSENKRLWLRE